LAIDSEEKAAKARELLAKMQSATNLMPEEAERTNANIDRLRASLGEYEKASRPVDEAGKLTADVPGSDSKVDGFDTDGGFFYEPSVESVKERLRSDPSLSERLNLRSWTSSPDQIERLNERDTAYAAVADDDWTRAAEQARTGKKNLSRYSKVQLSENPFQKALGFAGKHIPALAVAASNAIAPIAPDGDPEHEAWKQKALENSPEAATIGTFAGAASPASFGSQAANLAMKAGNYAARGTIGKAAIGAVGGALGSVGEGEMQAADQELSQEDPELQNYFDGIQERVTQNAIFGGGFGAGGDLLSQGAKAGAESLRNFSPAVKGLRELENAGGNLKMPMGPGSILSPVKVPDEIMGNFRASSADGEILSPLEIAANKVGPQIADSVDQQAQQAYRQAGESLEKYHNSPQGMSAKRVTKPARVMLDMIREGRNVGDFGTAGDAVPKISKKLRERLMNEVERKDVSLEEYDSLKARYGDDIIELDPNDADFVLGEDTQALGDGDLSDKAISPHIGRQEPFRMASEQPVIKTEVGARPQDVGTIRPGGGDLPGVGPGQPELQNPFRSASDIPAKPPAVDEFGAPVEVGDYTVFSDEDMPGLGPPARAPHNPFQPMHVNALIPQGFLEIDGPAPRAASIPPKPDAPIQTPEANIREVGTVPPKGKKKKADGDIKKVDRDVIPTNPYLETSKLGMNEYGQKMYPYRNSMRGSDLRTEQLMEEFPYVNSDPNVKPNYNTDPSAVEIAGTQRADVPSTVPPSPELSDAELRIAKDSLDRAYEEGVAVPNEGTFNPEDITRQIQESGGVDKAARLNKGMRDMEKPMSLYKNARTPEEATKIATSLEHPIELSIDNGSTSLRDGRHRLEAAKRAGATEIKARIRAFRPDGKAEEVGVMSVPIQMLKDNKGTIAGLAAIGGTAAAGEEDAALAGAGILGAGKGLKGKGNKTYPKGTKTVLVPRARNSRQIEKIQQDIAEDLQGISKDSDWLKKVDKAFRETRDQFEPNEFTPGEMTLDDGTKVTGLSALQRKHHELLQQIDEMKLDTSSKSKTAILNKIKAFASGQNGTADKELLEQAKKLGLEKELRQVAATRVVPGLKTAGSPLENEKGIFTGLKNAGIQRMLPVLEAVGNVPGNPFIANPNTPAGRIQKYLFENSAKNLLNFEGGRLGRFGNEVNDLRDKNK
jgi:hypothetical protein